MSIRDDREDKEQSKKGPEPRIDAATRQPTTDVPTMRWGIDPWGVRSWSKTTEEGTK